MFNNICSEEFEDKWSLYQIEDSYDSDSSSE